MAVCKEERTQKRGFNTKHDEQEKDSHSTKDKYPI